MKNGARDFLVLLRNLANLPARQRKLLSTIAQLITARKYTLAVIFVAAASALHWLVEGVVGSGYTYILYYPAVMLAALIGGLVPGLLATALSGAVVAWFFLTPRGSFSIAHFPDAFALGIFCFNGFFISFIAHRLRKATEEARMQSEEKLRLSQQLAEIGTFEWDIQTGIERWSPMLEAMYGLPQGGFAGRHDAWIKLVHPDDRAEAQRCAARSIAGFGPGEGEWRVVWPDGSVHWLAGRWHVARERSGQPTRAIGVSIDITGRRRAEEALRESEEKYHLIVETATEGIALIDDNARIALVNKRWSEMFGYTAEEARSMTQFDLALPEHMPLTKERWESRKQGIGERYESGFRRKDASTVWVQVGSQPIFDKDGTFRGILMMFTDITARKLIEDELRRSHNELEQRVRERTSELQQTYERLLQETEEKERAEEHLRQAQKMEALGTLAGGIAHDFNNMLAIIIGNAELALDDLGGSSLATQNIKQIVDASRRATDLIRQILAFSRKTEQGKNPLSLTPLIKETCKFLRSSLPATIAIKIDIQTSSDVISGNPSQILQVLMNLATNASYAMRDKGGTLFIGLSEITFTPRQKMPDADMQPGRYLKLTVKDTGTGMTDEVTKRLFEPFFTTKQPGMGTGMGLAVVYGIVKNHGGAISVESEMSQGSTFTVLLPSATERVQEATGREAVVRGGRESILLIDDEPAIVNATSRSLERLGYDVTVEVDSARALETFLGNPGRFDLVITDQTMPGITGINLAEKMLEVRKDLPIILMTGYSEAASPEAAKSAGISELLMKPIVKREMAETIRKVLDTSPERQH